MLFTNCRLKQMAPVSCTTHEMSVIWPLGHTPRWGWGGRSGAVGRPVLCSPRRYTSTYEVPFGLRTPKGVSAVWPRRTRAVLQRKAQRRLRASIDYGWNAHGTSCDGRSFAAMAVPAIGHCRQATYPGVRAVGLGVGGVGAGAPAAHVLQRRHSFGMGI
jgi:hypothetical protein